MREILWTILGVVWMLIGIYIMITKEVPSVFSVASAYFVGGFAMMHVND